MSIIDMEKLAMVEPNFVLAEVEGDDYITVTRKIMNQDVTYEIHNIKSMKQMIATRNFLTLNGEVIMKGTRGAYVLKEGIINNYDGSWADNTSILNIDYSDEDNFIINQSYISNSSINGTNDVEIYKSNIFSSMITDDDDLGYSITDSNIYSTGIMIKETDLSIDSSMIQNSTIEGTGMIVECSLYYTDLNNSIVGGVDLHNCHLDDINFSPYPFFYNAYMEHTNPMLIYPIDMDYTMVCYEDSDINETVYGYDVHSENAMDLVPNKKVKKRIKKLVKKHFKKVHKYYYYRKYKDDPEHVEETETTAE